MRRLRWRRWRCTDGSLFVRNCKPIDHEFATAVQCDGAIFVPDDRSACGQCEAFVGCVFERRKRRLVLDHNQASVTTARTLKPFKTAVSNRWRRRDRRRARKRRWRWRRWWRWWWRWQLRRRWRWWWRARSWERRGVNVPVRKERVPATLAQVVGAFRERDRDAHVAVHKGSEGRVDGRLGARFVARRFPINEIVLIQRRAASGEVHDGCDI